tara:strand:+ start:1880 stop:2140 length:261 start_codon:yes stop_codon:yes gene_type:complete
MILNNKVNLLIIAILIMLTLGANYSYSAITKGRSEELKIAFANGFVAAIKYEIEGLKELKRNEGLLKKKVMIAATNYVTMIERINP